MYFKFYREVWESVMEEYEVDLCLVDERSMAGADETSVQCNPKLSKVVGDVLYGAEVQNYGDPKKSFTVMFTSLADGTYIKPAILYSFLNGIPPNVLQEIDVDFFAFTGGGNWMTSELYKWWLVDVSISIEFQQIVG
jgi:hypothetical protein